MPTLASALMVGLLSAGTSVVGAPVAHAAGKSATVDKDWKVPRLALMPLGDSITWGAGSSALNGYRPELRDRLVAHAGDVNFVGSQETNGVHHEGHSGWQIDDLADNIDDWLAESRPNVVLLNIGTNDIDTDDDVEGAPRRLDDLVSRITSAAPDMTVLVSSLVPNKDAQAQKRVQRYNAEIPGIVARQQAKGAHVDYVDMGEVTVQDLHDWLHPNDAGFVKMAKAYYEGITRAAGNGWIRESVDVRPAPPHKAPLGDYRVDIDGDGKDDYLVVGGDGSVKAWVNNGGDGRGDWKNRGVIASGGASGSRVRFADINGDGKADYLVVGRNGSVRAFVNKGGGVRDDWEKYGLIATGAGPIEKVRFADVNGDGRADYLVVEDDGSVRAWLNNGAGDHDRGWTGVGQIISGVGAPGGRVRFADINGDGKADYLVVGDQGAVRALVNNGGDGHGGWIDRGQIATGAGPIDKVRFADIDGDRKADYLVVEDDGSVRAWRNNGADGRDDWTNYGRIASGAGPGYRVRI
ncbi:FG-GAP-like repeat-containing protein [Streptomyces gamaensis]|uniref:FG-GAP-like repeat-containing protein n=1 Tax=Streptomyces gamaensis TaxID=1763542 RepID=A0ABW0YSX8_9ACTN